MHGLLAAMLAVFFSRPGKFLSTLRLAWRMGKRGDRGRLYQLIYLAEACVLFRWLRASGAAHVHAHFGTNSTTVANHSTSSISRITRILAAAAAETTCR